MAVERSAHGVPAIAVEGVDVVQRRGAEDAVERRRREDRLGHVADLEFEVLELLGSDADRFGIDVNADDVDLRIEERQLVGPRARPAAHIRDARARVERKLAPTKASFCRIVRSMPAK